MSESAFVNAGGFATSRGAPDGADVAFIKARLGKYPTSAIARMVGRSPAYVNGIADVGALPTAQERGTTAKAPETPKAARARRVKLPRTKPVWRRSIPDTARKAIDAVALLHGVTVEALTAPWSQRGSNALCEVRQEAYHAVRALTKPSGKPMYSLPQIGAIFGGRDHGTVHHGIGAHEDRLAEQARAA